MYFTHYTSFQTSKKRFSNLPFIISPVWPLDNIKNGKQVRKMRIASLTFSVKSERFNTQSSVPQFTSLSSKHYKLKVRKSNIQCPLTYYNPKVDASANQVPKY